MEAADVTDVTASYVTAAFDVTATSDVTTNADVVDDVW